MLVRAMDSWPSPFILPFSLAEITVPMALDPFGIAVFPRTVTGCARVAAKGWPALLVLELKACSTVTVSAVPAGTMIGSGLGASAGAAAGEFTACAGATGSDITAV